MPHGRQSGVYAHCKKALLLTTEVALIKYINKMSKVESKVSVEKWK